MKSIWLALLLSLGAASASAATFSDWAVVIVAGDNHAHSGAPSPVFDNARRDLARAFAGIGFSPANIAQFSVSPDPAARPSDINRIASGLWDVSNRAPGGCLLYFTSHGNGDGMLIDGKILTPDMFGRIVDNACGHKPSVIVMSSCFSGAFVPTTQGPDRMIFTAARPDRTSFGCGESDHYTFFDGCFLASLSASGDFPTLADKTIACVGKQEQALGVEYPSEPQLAIGANVAQKLSWR